MKLGLLTAAFADEDLEQIAGWAGGEGFEALEVACWPRGEGAGRRYSGVSHIDVVDLDQESARSIRSDLDAAGLEISALAYYPNPLSGDEAEREAAHAHLRALIAAAPKLGVDRVTTFAGADRTLALPENLERFRELWPPLVAEASAAGVRICVENCPMIFSYDEWPSGNNLAYSPATWRRMFEAIPDPNFGLNLDPSHLIWQMIDIDRAVYEFGDRIHHVHGKDLEVRSDGLYEHGIMSAGIGWQVPRLCGLGQVDWGRFVAALYAVGYDDVIAIEHEDRRFEGSGELVRRGFRIARRNLAPLIA